MIFVTVGTELPFDRLISVVDRWARERDRDDVFAQIGEGGTPPKTIAYAHFLEPEEFRRKFAEASCIIAHAGMGTILSALSHEKPLLVMPRKASLGEQRNEHQLATATHLSKLGKLKVSFDEDDLFRRLDELGDLSMADQKIGAFASEALTSQLGAFISKI
ncbi:MAG: glycosyltransferase [Akkermansiaceae bacterium]